MDHRNRRLSMEPLENRCMLSASTGCEYGEYPVSQEIGAIQGRIAAIESALEQDAQPFALHTAESFDAIPAEDSPVSLSGATGEVRNGVLENGSDETLIASTNESIDMTRPICIKTRFLAGPENRFAHSLLIGCDENRGNGLQISVTRIDGRFTSHISIYPDGSGLPECKVNLPFALEEFAALEIIFDPVANTVSGTVSTAGNTHNFSHTFLHSAVISSDNIKACIGRNPGGSPNPGMDYFTVETAASRSVLEKELATLREQASRVMEANQAREATLDAQSQPAQISPLLSQSFQGADAAFNGSRAIDLGYVPEYSLQDFTISTTVVADGSAAEQVIMGLNTQANRSYGYSGITLNFRYGNGPLKIWYAAPDTNHEVITRFTPELGRAYDITISKQGKQLRLFVDGAHVEDLTLPVAEIRYNATGRTMLSGLWSGEKRSAIYQLNGVISELKVYGGAYAPTELARGNGQQVEEETLPVAQSTGSMLAQNPKTEAAPSYAPRMLLTVSGGGFDMRFRSPYDVTCFQVFAIRNKATGDKWCIGEETVSHPGGQPDGAWGWSSGKALLQNPEIKDIEVVMWCGAKGDKVADRAVGSISYGKLSLHTPQSAWEDILAEQRIESAVQPELKVLKAEGPNVLVHITSPANQSVVNIGGSGLLATRTQLHEGGTPSAIMQVTMNAGNPRGTYAIQLMNVPNGLVLDSVPVYWDGSSLSLLHAEDGMEGMPAEWDIPQEYCMSSALVRNNLQSELAERSGLLISPAAAEASFYERHPEYRPENLQATIAAEHARVPGFTRSQTSDRVLGDMRDLLTRMHRGLDALNSAIQSVVLPAAMNVFRGILNGVPEGQLHTQLDEAMRTLAGGRITDLYLHTKIAAPSRSAILAAARQVFFEETDLMEYYRAQDQKLLAKGVAPQTEDPFITAARQRGELWAQYMGQISAGQMTAAQALTALAANASSTSVAQAQQQAVDQVMGLLAQDPTLLASADDLLTLAEVEVGGVEVENPILTVSQTQIPIGGTVEVSWGFSRIYGADVAKVSLYLVDRSASGSAQEIMVLDDQCLSDGNYTFDTSKLIAQAGEYRILAVATLANGRLVGGQAEVRVGEVCQLPDGAVDLAKLKPRPDYEGHLGADYILDEGTPIVWTGPDAKIIEMRPVGGYGTMAIKLEICLAVPQVLEDETQSGSSVSTDKIHIILGHLRPTKESIANEDAQIRFNEGMLQNDISYKVGDVIRYGTLLGYVESVAYGGFSDAPHVHAGAYDAHAINELAAQNNLWRGTGVSDDSEIRGKFINIESLLQFLRA